MVKKVWNLNSCFVLLIAGQFLLGFVTLHGFAKNREGWGIFLLLLVLVCPFILLKRRSAASFFRLSTVYLAFMPVVSMTYLANLWDGRNLLTVAFGIDRNLSLWSGFSRDILPVMLLLWGVCLKKGFAVRKWHKVLLVCGAFVAMGVCFLPELSEVLLYVLSYLLVIVIYDWWEKLFAAFQERNEAIMMWLVFAVFFLRGCYRMLELLKVYPI